MAPTLAAILKAVLTVSDEQASVWHSGHRPSHETPIQDARSARRHIRARPGRDRASYLAGREFQRLYQLADRRRPDQPDGLAEDQRAAWESVGRIYKLLGRAGSSIVCGMLIDGMSIKEIAAARGPAGDERFFARRFYECLDCLAASLGFANEEKKIRASGAKTQNIGTL